MGIATAGTAPTASSTMGSKRYWDRLLEGWLGMCMPGEMVLSGKPCSSFKMKQTQYRWMSSSLTAGGSVLSA